MTEWQWSPDAYVDQMLDSDLRLSRVEIDWKMDLPDRLDDQLEWLLRAGFDAEPVCTFKDLAVVRARH